MKRVWFVTMAMISLFLTPTYGQNCDSLFVGHHTAMTFANGSPSGSSGAQFGSEFLFGKLEIVASASKWASSIGFETSIADSNTCRSGIVFSNGSLVIFRSFQEPGSDCPEKPQFRKSFLVSGWESLEEKEYKYTFVWREDNIDLMINDTLLVPHEPIPRDSLPNQPLQITFRTNIDLEFNPAELIDTVRTTYVCYSYFVPTGVVEHKQTLQRFFLSQNYPNRFNPQTTIRYELPQTTQIRLYVINEMGQRVRTLVSSTQTAGTYTMVWNGKDDFDREVASGVYLYQIVTDDFCGNQKTHVGAMNTDSCMA